MGAADTGAEGVPGGADAPGGKLGDVYRDILEWSASLARWQNELLRRLLRAKELSEAEVSELATAAVAETEQQTSNYPAMSANDLPVVGAAGEHRLLAAMRGVRNVNALRADQTLTFGPQLTVVYGDNASGKSGYCRVLKKVYRARVVEDILGDVRAEAAPAGAAAATFVVKAPGGAEQAIAWTDGVAISDAGRFAVLDSACSLTYVRGGTLAVGPAGIDVLDRFAVELDRVKRHIAALAAQAQPSKKSLQHLEDDTEAGRFVKSLSSATSDEAITATTAWSPEQEAELQRLDSARIAARASTPAARRAELKARSEALRSLCTRVANWIALVSDAHATELRQALAVASESDAALSAVRSLGDAEVSAERLKGTVWDEMVRAAVRYVRSFHATTGGQALSIDGRCVLCWQHLDDAAKQRLDRFQQHLEGAAQKARQAAVQCCDELLAAVQRVPEAVSPQDEVLVVRPEGLAERLRLLAGALARRREQICEAAQSGEWPALASIDAKPLEEIRALSAAADASLAALPASDASAEEELAGLENSRRELAARKALAQAAGAVRDFVRNTREVHRFKSAESAINTRAASKKAGELHAKHMTERYAKLVDDELREPCFQRQKPVLAQKTNKAKVEVTPLISAEMKHLSAERVFSEGERTAIALACFLAELRLGSDPSGLIFDDPVSSLDHNVREHVARRLVAAAKERQVIVFTHDLAFLADLREQAKIQEADSQFRTLTATEYDAGFVEEEEPFGARNVGKRIRFLKALLVAVESTAKKGDLQAFRGHAREFYERLRSTWERFIEERLFGQVVRRLERHVMPGALGKVIYSRDIAEQVQEGWRRCSTAIGAHDHAPAAGENAHSVESMKQDLQRLLDADLAADKASGGSK
jgi:energy-coupling factor transporter ATP-binding protein EcfA2